MKKYQCHKIVEAAKIIRIQGQPLAPGWGSNYLHFEEGGGISVSSAWMEKHKPLPGGWFVRYPDGYTSYSPPKAFEEGYTLVTV